MAQSGEQRPSSPPMIKELKIWLPSWSIDCRFESFRELLLIEACQIYGLGIWSDIADGSRGNGRTKEEAKRQ
ncbi:uncharacterized protein VP01_1543g3 [Puccinia sorghi]|uniref:SANT domain-containing protein n=1 Tax=Puccinia sorghi TaxID=27349 RepID=A0A0L6VIB7_9BASI|nr:uncharacterized protein VP01_1543g3 [Puccinia sorghi]